MLLLPSLCESCRLVFLASSQDAQTVLTCAKCGSSARVIPGCSYGEADVPLFSELSQVVAEGRIAPVEAGRLAVELERALLAKTYGHFFELLSTRLPGLTPIQLMFGRSPPAQHRAFIMLKTILDALALASRSGTMSKIGPEADALVSVKDGS